MTVAAIGVGLTSAVMVGRDIMTMVNITMVIATTGSMTTAVMAATIGLPDILYLTM